MHVDVDDDKESTSNWMPEISLTTAMSLVGITLTAVDLYFRYKKGNTPAPTPVRHKMVYHEEEPVVKVKTHAPTIGME